MVGLVVEGGVGGFGFVVVVVVVFGGELVFFWDGVLVGGCVGYG